MTSVAPAASSSPSMFCVMWIMVRPARALCAALGSAAPMVARRSEYHSMTNSGSRSNASGVATVDGSTLFQIPSGSRNVSKPDSADSPAPENDTTISASSITPRARAITSSMPEGSPPSASAAAAATAAGARGQGPTSVVRGPLAVALASSVWNSRGRSDVISGCESSP